MKLGTYRNPLGAELTVTNAWIPTARTALGTPVGYQTLGGIYEAETPRDMFGQTHYLVTDESLSAAGYELAEDPESAKAELFPGTNDALDALSIRSDR